MPKVVSRAAVSSSTDAQPTASSAAALRVYYCICGEFILVLDASLSALPRRKTDNATIIRCEDSPNAKARVFKLNAAPSDPILIERDGGHELKSGPFLYILPGALTQMQGQVPQGAFDGEDSVQETLLREKEDQIIELGDEVTRLRHYLSSQPGPSTTDPVTLPPPLVSLLLPHLHTQTDVHATHSQLEGSSQSNTASSQVSGSQNHSSASTSSLPTSTTASNTMHTALSQRVKLLQGENDELYEILKQSETGRLKEEVQSLRRLVEKLEGALRESHTVIVSLSNELDKSYDSFLASSKQNNYNSKGPYPGSGSPRTGSNSYSSQQGLSSSSNSNGSAKLPPTGPRAHKKPRLSEAPHNNPHAHSSPSTSPHLRNNTALPSQTQNYQSSTQHHQSHGGSGGGGGGGHGPHHHQHHHQRSHSRHREPREHPEHSSPRASGKGNVNQNYLKLERMDVDEDSKDAQEGKARMRSPERRRDVAGHRDRGREREKNRERDKERGGSNRRNGVSNSGRTGGGSRRGEKTALTDEDGGSGNGGDRTLAERLGL
ncbi:hypothetical protein D9758_008831 [Tetrapyrgos nigripes]|uniref:STEEP1 domain-containing protein n=1 Tax=Tetrapyrgos nigripes TaxID=182062 RepID=A0A8H5FP80_9AGAR|nr:hypothetical protein D9758_008831 [Tetrapyrgos nigripes]